MLFDVPEILEFILVLFEETGGIGGGSQLAYINKTNRSTSQQNYRRKIQETEGNKEDEADYTSCSSHKEIKGRYFFLRTKNN